MAFITYFFLDDWKAYVVAQSARGFKTVATARNFLAEQTYDLLERQYRLIVLLVTAYPKYFPQTPQYTWLYSIEVAEHSFGITHSV